MASIYKDIPVVAAPADAWDAVRDFGALHRRLAPGFVVDADLDGTDRVVTFATGAQARERLVTADGERRRLVYTVVESRLGAVHHQASVEVADAADGSGAVLRWTTDVLPDELAPVIAGMMDKGAEAISRALGA